MKWYWIVAIVVGSALIGYWLSIMMPSMSRSRGYGRLNSFYRVYKKGNVNISDATAVIG